tara:strand:+ start:475 stop:1809 length:1335 start_codon:yes stop_codon:yes gene_type:complete
MDEDQQQDDQQEEKQEEQQPIAPSAFTSFNITPVRRPISSLALFQRQSAENDEQIRGVVRKNQEAINKINTSLMGVTIQVSALSKSLVQVAEQIKQTAALENLRNAQEQKQAAMLADRNARRNTENNLERGIQGALFAPVQRIGAKARFTLGRLVTFFNILLGGFLVGRVIKTLEALVNGDGEALKNIGDTIVKQLTAAGGIFVAINGGMLIALRSLTKLASFLTQVAVNNLILKPIRLVFSIARAAAAAIIGGAASGLRNLPPLISPGGGSGKPGQIKGKRKLTGGIKTNALFALGLAEFDRRSGTPANEAYGRAFMNIGTNAFFQGLGGVLNRQGMPPYLRVLGLGFQIGGPFAGFGVQQGVFDPLMGIQPEQTNQLINQSVEQIRIRQGDPEINILPEVRTQDAAPMSVEGRAALLMFVEPFNKKNPYVLNSFVQYNVIPV